MDLDIHHFWPEWSEARLIGQGSFGKVYKISRQKNNYTFYAALKVIHIPVSETEIEEYYDQGLDDNTIRKILLERVKLLENEIVLMEYLKSAANVVSIEDH